ncbi:Uncharacterised protein [Bordetella pertussis]|nr:Uncharacterised protein [Bordetella pertussis]
MCVVLFGHFVSSTPRRPSSTNRPSTLHPAATSGRYMKPLSMATLPDASS